MPKKKEPYVYPHSIFMAGKEYAHVSQRGLGYNNYTNLPVEYPQDL